MISAVACDNSIANQEFWNNIADRYGTLQIERRYYGETAKRIGEYLHENEGNLTTRVLVLTFPGLANALVVSEDKDHCILSYDFFPKSMLP